MNSQGPEQTARICRVIQTFTFYQYILQQSRSFHKQQSPRADNKDMPSDPDLHFSPVDSTTAKEHIRKTCRLIPSIFTSRFYKSQNSFHEQQMPRANYKDMQADPDLHYSPVDSTTAMILWTAKDWNRLQGHTCWSRTSFFTRRF